MSRESDAADLDAGVEDEPTLWRQFRENASIENRKSLSAFYLPFVRLLASSIFSRLKLSGVEFADYVSFGVIGLFDAIERFKELEVLKFKPYASFRIKGEIYNGIVKFSDKSQFEAYKRRLHTERLASIAKETSSEKQDADNFESIVELSSMLVMSEIVNDDDLLATVEWDGSAAMSEDHNLYSRMISKLHRLSELEMQVLCYHYLSDLPFKEIGQLLSLSKSRISQIHVAALKQLKLLLLKVDDFEKLV